MSLRILNPPASATGPDTGFFPPWTVRNQIWADALRPYHSGVSTDVLLFSEIHLSLSHHYRVFCRGLPHFAFRRDYLDRLWIFVSQASALQQYILSSPALGSLGSTGNTRPGDVETGSPRKTRRIHGWKHVVRVRDAPVCDKSRWSRMSGSWQAISCMTAVRPSAGLDPTA